MYKVLSNTQNAIFLDTNASENKIVIARKRQSRRFIVSAVLMADKTLNEIREKYHLSIKI